jgi:hypothetical protein
MKRLGLFCTNDLMLEDCSVPSRYPLHQVGCTVNQEDAELTVKCGVSKRWDHIHTLRSPIKLLFESNAKSSCVDVAFRYHSCTTYIAACKGECCFPHRPLYSSSGGTRGDGTSFCVFYAYHPHSNFLFSGSKAPKSSFCAIAKYYLPFTTHLVSAWRVIKCQPCACLRRKSFNRSIAGPASFSYVTNAKMV